MMRSYCLECGAPIPEGGACRDNFHALLALEAEVPGAAGSIVHFFTVATYNLQHPVSMGFTVAALHGLREAHARALDGTGSVKQLRAVVKAGAAAAGRVTRRTGEPVPDWPTGGWSMTCRDVIEGGVAAFPERIREWAKSVREKLDREMGGLSRF